MPNKRAQRQIHLNVAERAALGPKGNVPNKRAQRQTRLNVPALRFPEFEGEWETKSIDNVAKVVGGGTPDTSNKSYWDGTILWFTPSEIGKDKYVESSSRKITREGLDSSSAKILPVHTILLSSRATVGECSIALKECTTNQGFQSLISENCDFEFLYYLIQTKKKELIKKACGSTFSEISANEVRKIQIDIPLDKEQVKISRFLSILDDRIATQRKIIEKLESLMIGINNVLDATYANEISVSFSEISTDYNGLSGKSADDFGDGAPYISYVQVNSNIEISDNQGFPLVNIHTSENQNKVKRGDLLVTLSSEIPEEVAVCASYMGNANCIYLNSFCFGLHFTDSLNTFAPYFAYLSNTKRFRRFVYPLAQGSTRYNLHKQDFLRNKIALPSRANQKKIYTLLSAYSHKVEYEKIVLEKLTKQKQYLLSKMFI